MNPALTNIIMLIVGVVGIPAAIAFLAAWVVVRTTLQATTDKIRESIKAEYAERLQRLTSDLQAAAARELEEQKYSLLIEADRQRIRYSRLHETRAQVIGDVYAALAKTYEGLRSYAAPLVLAGSPTKDEQFDTLKSAQKDFAETFLAKRIYLPSIIADQLSEINSKILTTGYLAMYTIQQKSQDNAQQWVDLLKDVEGPIKASLRKLEDDLRDIMGDPE